MSRALGIASLVAALMLAGCGSPPIAPDYLAAVHPCCVSLQQLEAVEGVPGEQIRVSLSQASPIVELQGSRSHALRLALPPDFQPSALTFKSFLTSAYLPNASVLYPRFSFLDKQQRPLGPPVLPQQLRNAVDFWRGGYIEASVPVPAHARHVVVTAALEGVSAPVVYSENRTAYHPALSPVGQLELRFFGH